MSEIRAGVWSVQKGGPDSGHHGHAGRPGKQGGSFPRSGLGTSLLSLSGWSGLSGSEQKEFLRAVSQLPRSSQTTLEFVEMPDVGPGGRNELTRGRFLPKIDKIELNLVRATPATIFHEAGHFIFDKRLTRGQKRKVRSDFIRGRSVWFEERERVHATGLWPNAVLKDAGEFWASSFALALDKGFNNAYRRLFPDTVELVGQESTGRSIKGGETSGHYGHGGRPGQQGGSVEGTTLRAISQHVWDRAGKRARFKLIRTAVGHLRKNPVLPESRKAKWHLPMVFEGKVAGILVGDDARAVTVLSPKMKPYEGSQLVRF